MIDAGMIRAQKRGLRAAAGALVLFPIFLSFLTFAGAAQVPFQEWEFRVLSSSAYAAVAGISNVDSGRYGDGPFVVWAAQNGTFVSFPNQSLGNVTRIDSSPGYEARAEAMGQALVVLVRGAHSGAPNTLSSKILENGSVRPIEVPGNIDAGRFDLAGNGDQEVAFIASGGENLNDPTRLRPFFGLFSPNQESWAVLPFPNPGYLGLSLAYGQGNWYMLVARIVPGVYEIYRVEAGTFVQVALPEVVLYDRSCDMALAFHETKLRFLVGALDPSNPDDVDGSGCSRWNLYTMDGANWEISQVAAEIPRIREFADELRSNPCGLYGVARSTDDRLVLTDLLNPERSRIVRENFQGQFSVASDGNCEMNIALRDREDETIWLGRSSWPALNPSGAPSPEPENGSPERVPSPACVLVVTAILASLRPFRRKLMKG